MAKLEAVALNKVTPQGVVPQVGDTYQFPRDIFMTTGVLTSEVADGATAVAFKYVSPAYVTAGAKLWSVWNDVTEVFYVDKDGNVVATGAIEASASYNNQTGTTYTIAASDNGKIITFNNAAAIAVTLPDSLDTDFQCTIIQIGAGVPTVTRSGTDTINGAATGVTPSAQWKGMYLSQYAAGTWLALV